MAKDEEAPDSVVIISGRSQPRMCPQCKTHLDGLTSAGPDGRHEPDDGDVTMCAECLAICIFADGGRSMRLATPEEIADLSPFQQRFYEKMRTSGLNSLRRLKYKH